MRRFLAAGALLALAVAAIAGAATNTTYHTITVDGSCADWASDEIFQTTDTGFTVYLTWDAATLYIGWAGESNSELSRYAAFDLDRGTDDGSNATLGTTSFSNSGQPEFAVEYSFGNAQSFLFFYTRVGDGFNSSAQNPALTSGAFSASGCGGGPFVEVGLDRSLFNPQTARPLVPDPNSLNPTDDLGVYAWWQVNERLIEGSMPAANNNTSPLKYEAYCPTTDGGRSPNTYCGGSTRAVVASFASHGRTLTWRTGSELGVLGFDVLRDGRKIAFVRAKGAVRGSTYRYVDRAAHAGSRHVYRLRVVRF